MNNVELNTVAKDLLAVRSMIQELEQEAENLTDALKREMVERGVEVLDGDGWSASWKNVESRRFDSRAFKKVQPEVYAAFCRPTTSTRFLISA